MRGNEPYSGRDSAQDCERRAGAVRFSRGGRPRTYPRAGPRVVIRRIDVRQQVTIRIERRQLIRSDLAVRELGPDELAPFDPDGRLLTNVNTPADYERARAPLGPGPATA